MTGLAIILLIVGVVLLLLGIFVEAAKFLLWIGIVIIVIAVIAYLFRYIRRRTLRLKARSAQRCQAARAEACVSAPIDAAGRDVGRRRSQPRAAFATR